MLGRPVTQIISEESKAQASLDALGALFAMEEKTEEVLEAIERNVVHLELVLPALSFPADKLTEIEETISAGRALLN
jgi:hypothetical protein